MPFLTPRAVEAPGLVLAVVVAASVMDQLDTTVTNVAGPSVRADLGGGDATVQWLVAAYTLPFAALLITGGRLGDVFGRRRTFLAGLAGFTLASLACAAAPAPATLIAARALQGAFGALLIPQGLGLLVAAVPRERLPSAFGAFAPAIGLASAAGPPLAGALIAADVLQLGWRAVFLVNVPVGVVLLLLALWVLPADDAGERPVGRLDPVGTGLLTASAALLVFPLVQGRSLGWPAWTWLLLAGGLFGFAAFAVQQRRTARLPLIAPSLLRDVRFRRGLPVMLGVFGALAGTVLVLALYLQVALGFSALHAGLTGVPLSLGIGLTAARARAAARRIGRRLLPAGLVLAGVGLVVSAVAVAAGGRDLTSLMLAPGLLLVGAGLGLVFGPLYAAILGGVPADASGSASGVLSAAQQLGGVLGVAALGALFLGLADRAGATAAAVVTLAAAAGAIAAACGLTFLLPAPPADAASGGR